MPSFSRPVPDEIVVSSGLRSRFPTHVHRNYEACVEAAKGIEAEYNQTMLTNIESKTLANIPGLGPVHPMALTIANCLPERLSAITRFADFTILNDDYYDFAKKEEIQEVNHGIQSAIQGFAPTGSAPTSITTSSSSSAFKAKQLQAGLMLELIALDQDFALNIMSTYSQGLDIATFAPEDLKTLEEYLPLRSINSGLDVTADMACFGTGINISHAEKEKLREATALAKHAITIVNDLYSWPKEIKCHLETPNSSPPFNAVAILMQHRGCSESEAFHILIEKQAELEEEHLRLVQVLRDQEGGRLPENQELYLANAQQAVSGSELWSIYTTRYPSKMDLEQPEVEFVDGKFRFNSEINAVVEKVNEPTTSVSQSLEKQMALLEVASISSSSALGQSSPSSSVCEDSHVNDDSNASKINSQHRELLAPRQEGSCTRMKALLPDSPDLPTYASRVAAAPDHPAMAPFKYIASLPSKGVRDTFIDALNWWLQVPEDSLLTIKTIISMLHDSSLLLDDIEDDSTLRRGSPAAHIIYGTAQCINAANYMVVMVLAELQKLRSPIKTAILIEELESLFLGQSEDLFWKYQVECPSIEDYMEMIDNKTGGLFRLCVRLLQAESTRTDVLDLDPRPFVRQLSLYFQIRDDFQNLVSNQYAKQKGFAEDLDEGKISLPMILTLQRVQTRPEIMGIMKHKKAGPMPLEIKQFIIAEMKKSGALETTHELLLTMQEDLIMQLRDLERDFGSRNPTLELVLKKLWIS
ncbi:geranylgeranyl pyrophosphate synthase [Colletotrichum caudatum]|nr:geranylgeranyl pyrophosphate synthase [Colletotrichum caudatum]